MPVQPARPSSPQLGLLEVVNPPLAISAVAECLAGACLARASLGTVQPFLLALASGLLFAAGSTFGYYFDRATSASQYARRAPEPGAYPTGAAWRVAWGLLLAGAVLPASAGAGAALAGIGVALLVVVYAAVTRSAWGVGFLTFGAARGVNFLLGLSAEPMGVPHYGLTAVAVAVYATGWAVLRSSRQPGAPPTTAFGALVHLVGGVAVVLHQGLRGPFYWVDALPFLVILLALTFPRFVSAVMEGRHARTAEAVQYGFLGLLLLEATLAAGYGGLLAGMLVAALCGPLYLALRRWPIPLVTEPR
ncbi:MAG TPA: hypothetical protein VK689_06185 [Armatimonadota bacterium]|nr:hypothetical protein [Armatimonadota bacterium]